MQFSSSNDTLWTTQYTTDGFNIVPDESKLFRIASNTKIFTALATLQLHAVDKLNLDRSVTEYLPNLTLQGSGHIELNGISARALMSHLSGLPDDFASEDILTLGGQSLLGLRIVSNATIASLPACEQDPQITCDSDGLFSFLKTKEGVFPPNTEASYSNIGYDLLGQVISSATGQSYEEYIQHMIIGPLGLIDTTFQTPANTQSVVPDGDNAYGHDLGIDNASGGLYSSARDMTQLLQYSLLNYRSISPAINWFQPQTYSTGSHSFIGMPWEIFRSIQILKDTNRPTTFVTKGGGLLGYYSYTVLMPDYNLAGVILLAGNVGSITSLLDIITTPLIRDVEALAQQNLADQYAGHFIGTSEAGENTSLTLTQSSSRSLYMSEFSIGDIDVLSALKTFTAAQDGLSAQDTYFQLIATFQSTTMETNHLEAATSEVWRFINVSDAPALNGTDADIWNDYCVANFDSISRAGRPLNKVVLQKDVNGDVVALELTAWNVTLTRNEA